MKHKGIRIALVVIEACIGLAVYLWMAEYRGHSFLTGHASHA